MSKLTTLTEAESLCPVGSKPPRNKCGDCIWNRLNGSLACNLATQTDMYYTKDLKRLADTLEPED